jgi:hypothetical protein
MENLVLVYTQGDFYSYFTHTKPFKYSNKEQFLLDIIENPLILKEFNIFDDSNLTSEILDEIEVFTLEEWFSQNEIKL